MAMLQLKKSDISFKEGLDEAMTILSNKKEWVLKTQTHYEINVDVNLTVGYDRDWLDLVVSLPACWLEDEEKNGREWISYEINSWPIITLEEGKDFGLLPPSKWPEVFYAKAVERVRGYLDDFLKRCPDPFGRKAEDFRITLTA